MNLYPNVKVTPEEKTTDSGRVQRGGSSGSGDGKRRGTEVQSDCDRQSSSESKRVRVRIDRDTEVDVEYSGEAQSGDEDEAPAASEEEFQRAVGERARRIPHGPSKEEERLHRITHVPFRSW